MKRKLSKQVILFILLILSNLSVLAQESVKVACVGNSITEGSGLRTTYPQALQAMLGERYQIRNFGLGGRTLLKKGNLPYWKEEMYAEVLGWQPDIVIIKLGTNDSKPQNWQYSKHFVKDYKALIKSFKSLPSKPEIFICYPIPVFEDKWGISEAVVREKILPAITRIARKAKVQTIDLYNPMLGKPQLTYDGVHPNEEGAALLAAEVYKALQRTTAISRK